MNEQMVKPVYIMCEAGVTVRQEAIVTRAIEVVSEGAGVNLSVHNYGNWRLEGYKTREGHLVPYRSTAWYLAIGRRNSPGRAIESTPVFQRMLEEPWQKQDPHYEVVILQSRLYAGNGNYPYGVASPEFGCMISTQEIYRQFQSDWADEVLKTMALHEIGHVFGAPNEHRPKLNHLGGQHCTHRCVMRQRLHLQGWLELTMDRLNGIYCRSCAQDMFNYFHG